MKQIKIIIFVTVISFMFLIPASAFPPPHPQFSNDAEMMNLFKNHLKKQREMKQSIRKSPSFKSFQYPAATGQHKICVILLEFTNKSFNAQYNASYYHNKIFNLNENSLAKYYNECSYNKFNLIGSSADVYGPFTSSKTMEYYGRDGNDVDNFNSSPHLMIQEAIELAESSVNFANYDYNGDGKVDHLIVIHSGGNQAVTHSTNDIWSHNWFVNGPYETAYQTNDGVAVYTYSTFEENAALGMMAHEFGHDLGLADLYNTESGDAVVGDWCLMDHGLYNGPGDNGSSPAHPSVYNKVFLNWISPSVINSGYSNYSLNNIEVNDVAVKIPHPSASNPSKEYYLITNRQKKGYDSYIPGHGVLVWHIDENIGSMSNNNINDFTPPRVKLIAQDNTYPDWNNGDSGDPWKNNQTGLTATSVPNNAAHNGQVYNNSPIISYIGASGDAMTLNILSGYHVTEDVLINSINYSSGNFQIQWSVNPEFSELANISYYIIKIYYGMNSSPEPDSTIETVSSNIIFSTNSPVSVIRVCAYNSNEMLLTQSKETFIYNTDRLVSSNPIYIGSNIQIVSNDNVEIQNTPDYSGTAKDYILLESGTDTFVNVGLNSAKDLNLKINTSSRNYFVNVPALKSCNLYFSKPDNSNSAVAKIISNSDYNLNSIVQFHIADETNSIVSTDFSQYFANITFVWQDTSVGDIRHYSLMYYNESTGSWEPALSSIEYNNTIKTIKGVVNHLTMFAIKKVGSSIEKVFVYPNPHIPSNKGKIKFFYTDSNDTGFDFPKNTELKVFDVSGQLIKKTLKSTDSGTGDPYDSASNQNLLNWDLTDESNKNVASGVYLYLIETPIGKKFSGKCAVIR